MVWWYNGINVSLINIMKILKSLSTQRKYQNKYLKQPIFFNVISNNPFQDSIKTKRQKTRAVFLFLSYDL